MPAPAEPRIPSVRARLAADLAAVAELPYGGPDDEVVDQLAHALQAATLAAAAGARPALIAAALLHDIGRSPAVCAQFPGLPHERAGAAYCTRLVGHEVGWLVGSHVVAKRVLVATDPAYAQGLSPVSVRSLARQGGPAEPEELARFLRGPLAVDALALRRWDDAAKTPGALTLTLDEALDRAAP